MKLEMEDDFKITGYREFAVFKSKRNKGMDYNKYIFTVSPDSSRHA